MPAKPKERQYRYMSVPLVPFREGGIQARAKRFDTECYVEGYASTFNDPYLLWRDWSGNEFFEVVDPGAFADADMSDIIMQYNHTGHVYARNSNKTLVVEPDEHGLFVAADLSRTTSAREMFEEIQAEMVTRMSWAFTIAESKYNKETRTTTITRVKKVFDVSAVSIPADPNTEISARCLLGGVIERERKELAQRRLALAKARATLAIMTARKD